MDPSLSPSKRFSNVNPHDFINFNFPISNRIEEPKSKSSRRSGVGILHKLLDFLKPLCKKISNFGCKGASSTTCVEGGIIGNKINWGSSEGTSLTPRTSIANYSEDDWRRSCDSETSIYEAVLHCKRTINGDE
ncbi:hypothetical protein HAX54_016597 [Datura stramonium]|uniref:Uncharacterized protein n=1 Tax=Datura stramonium TaxID=4076 RepID=A0ABS8UJ34_DATST|nr:hypothetical protein [Datura stramonium]